MTVLEPSMSYEAIDEVIRAWAEGHGLTLCTEFAGPRRFSYVNAGPRECFQVSIEPPEDGGEPAFRSVGTFSR